MTGRVRRTKGSGLYRGCAAAVVCLGMLLVGGYDGGSIGFFLLGAAFFAGYGIIMDRHDRVDYDGDGITLYTVWGRPILYRWNQLLVDTAVERLPEKRLDVGPVLRVHVWEDCGKATVYRYPFKYYKGLAEFLAFADCRDDGTPAQH